MLAVECSFFVSNLIALVWWCCRGSAPAHCPTWPLAPPAQTSRRSVASDRLAFLGSPGGRGPHLLSVCSFLALPSPATPTSLRRPCSLRRRSFRPGRVQFICAGRRTQTEQRFLSTSRHALELPTFALVSFRTPSRLSSWFTVHFCCGVHDLWVSLLFSLLDCASH